MHASSIMYTPFNYRFGFGLIFEEIFICHRSISVLLIITTYACYYRFLCKLMWTNYSRLKYNIVLAYTY